MIKRQCLVGAMAAVVAVALLVPMSAAGQASTPWGDPDLQGVWDYRTLTPLERPDELAGKDVFTEEEAAEFVAASLAEIEGRDDAVPGDIVGNYNQFWFDRGTTVVGTRRTSQIVDPPNGRLPALTPEAERQATSPEARRFTNANRGIVPPISWLDTDPGDRCIQHAKVGPPSTLARTTIIFNCFRHPVTSRFSMNRIMTCASFLWMDARIWDPAFGSGWGTRAATGRARHSSSRRPISMGNICTPDDRISPLASSRL